MSHAIKLLSQRVAAIAVTQDDTSFTTRTILCTVRLSALAYVALPAVVVALRSGAKHTLQQHARTHNTHAPVYAYHQQHPRVPRTPPSSLPAWTADSPSSPRASRWRRRALVALRRHAAATTQHAHIIHTRARVYTLTCRSPLATARSRSTAISACKSASRFFCCVSSPRSMPSSFCSLSRCSSAVRARSVCNGTASTGAHTRARAQKPVQAVALSADYHCVRQCRCRHHPLLLPLLDS
jgi:hypothetical protein